jgi:hypothetical protein
MIVQAVEECSPPDTVTLDGEKADAFTDLAHVSRHRCLSMTKTSRQVHFIGRGAVCWLRGGRKKHPSCSPFEVKVTSSE